MNRWPQPLRGERAPAGVEFIPGAVVVAFYAWVIAEVIRRASGHSGSSAVHVAPTEFLAGVLVVYLGGLLWAVSFAGSAAVAYPRSGPPALFTVGRGPGWARLTTRKGTLQFRLWSWGASYRSLESQQSISLEQERRILRATLWPGFATAAVVAALALVLPGRAWILATSAVCAIRSFSSLLNTRATGPVAQLRAMKAYPAATALRKQARAAMVQRDYEQALLLATQALAEPHADNVTWQMQLFAGSACMQLGRFVDAVRHLELAAAATSDEKMTAAIRGAVGDAKLSESLRTRTPLPSDELAQVRAWVEATPPGETDEVRSALAHRLAMLRLLEGDPAQAVSLCEPAVQCLAAQPEAHSRPEWQVAAATLVIAYARSGRTGEAMELMAKLPPDGSLSPAASAELAAAVDGSASGV